MATPRWIYDTCPRCGHGPVEVERNYGKPVPDGRLWCFKCGMLWFADKRPTFPSYIDTKRNAPRGG